MTDWSDEHVSVLQTEWSKGSNVKHIAKLLRRTSAQILMKRFHLGLPSRFERSEDKKPRGRSVATHLTQSDYDAFQALCARNGISMAGAVRRLVQASLRASAN